MKRFNLKQIIISIRSNFEQMICNSDWIITEMNKFSREVYQFVNQTNISLKIIALFCFKPSFTKHSIRKLEISLKKKRKDSFQTNKLNINFHLNNEDTKNSTISLKFRSKKISRENIGIKKKKKEKRMVARLKISFPPATGYNRPWTSTVNSGTGVLKYCIAFLPPFTQETNGLYSGRVPRRGRAIDFHSDERLSIITIKTWPLFAVTSWLGNIGYKREIGDTKFQIYIYIYTRMVIWDL